MGIFNFLKKRDDVPCFSVPHEAVPASFGMIEDRIEILRYIIDADPRGHLSLCHRIDLLAMWNDVDKVERFCFEFVKRFQHIWYDNLSNDNTLFTMLTQVNDYLYLHKGSKEMFSKLGHSFQDYLMQLLSGEHRQAAYIGLAAQSLSYIIAYDAEMIFGIDEYAGEDDDVFDYEGWSPGFYSSMAYSGGNPFLGEGDLQLRKKFWNMFLDTFVAFSDPKADLVIEPVLDYSKDNCALLSK